MTSDEVPVAKYGHISDGSTHDGPRPTDVELPGKSAVIKQLSEPASPHNDEWASTATESSLEPLKTTGTEALSFAMQVS